jgi:hypothetical protein
MRHCFIDCEWTLDQNIFLLSYAFKDGDIGSVYGRNLNTRYMRNLLYGVRFIYVYGPDVAYMEKNFSIRFKERYYCINLLKLFKLAIPGLSSYKLEYLEKLFRIPRSTRKYKTSVFTIWRHWHHVKKRQHVIRYNLEDAANLRSLFELVQNRYHISKNLIMRCRLL